jgi:hypothetical protein
MENHAVTVREISPALASVPEACKYLGGLSRAALYEILDRLEKVKIGSRTFITVRSLDKLIASNIKAAPPKAA